VGFNPDIIGFNKHQDEVIDESSAGGGRQAIIAGNQAAR